MLLWEYLIVMTFVGVVALRLYLSCLFVAVWMAFYSGFVAFISRCLVMSHFIRHHLKFSHRYHLRALKNQLFASNQDYLRTVVHLF